MPLSDHEQRLLEQIERALYAEDPKFASTVSSTDLRTHARRRVRRAIVLLVLGMAALLAGVMTTQVALGVAGFCLMFFALVYVASQYKKLSGRPDLRVAGSDRPGAPGAGSSGGCRCCSGWKSASVAASTTAERSSRAASGYGGLRPGRRVSAAAG